MWIGCRRLPIICSGRWFHLITGKDRNGHQRMAYISFFHQQDDTASLMSYYPCWRQSWGVVFHRRLSVCLYIRTISRKPQRPGSSNLMYKWSTMSSRKTFILGSKVQRSRLTSHKKQCQHVFLHECWLFLVVLIFSSG